MKRVKGEGRGWGLDREAYTKRRPAMVKAARGMVIVCFCQIDLHVSQVSEVRWTDPRIEVEVLLWRHGCVYLAAKLPGLYNCC